MLLLLLLRRLYVHRARENKRCVYRYFMAAAAAAAVGCSWPEFDVEQKYLPHLFCLSDCLLQLTVARNCRHCDLTHTVTEVQRKRDKRNLMPGKRPFLHNIIIHFAWLAAIEFNMRFICLPFYYFICL